MMMTENTNQKVTITKCDESNPFELVRFLPGQSRPQDVELTLYSPGLVSHGLGLDARAATGNTVSLWLRSRLLFKFKIPLLTSRAANELMADAEVQRLALEICAGWSFERVDGNLVGELTEEAMDAQCDLIDLLKDWGDGEGQVAIWDCGSWWADKEQELIDAALEGDLDQNDLEVYLDDADSDQGPVYLTGKESFAAKIMELVDAQDEDEDEDEDE